MLSGWEQREAGTAVRVAEERRGEEGLANKGEEEDVEEEEEGEETLIMGRMERMGTCQCWWCKGGKRG